VTGWTAVMKHQFIYKNEKLNI